ncbi:MAG: hypothetical protein O7D36_07205 [Gammaproteobacteria bacterium]|nr:hypothetical protein [Gammaproteobacteria bacterium]
MALTARVFWLGKLTCQYRANCFIVLPDDNAGVEAGDEVNIQFFDWSL